MALDVVNDRVWFPSVSFFLLSEFVSYGGSVFANDASDAAEVAGDKKQNTDLPTGPFL